MSSLTSTTTSAITLTNILTGAAIAIAALIFLLALKDVMSKSDSWNANTAATRRLQMVSALIPRWRDSFNANTGAALMIMSIGLIVTFCAFFAFTTAQFI
jgi:hypothetical protein